MGNNIYGDAFNYDLTLDEISGVVITPDNAHKYTNELGTAGILACGLHNLYWSMVEMEKVFRDQYENTSVMPIDGIKGKSAAMLFQWYAVSLINYLRTIGQLGINMGIITVTPNKYIEAIVPDVKVFRDKIAAHTAFASSNNKDSDADQLASILPFASYQHGRVFCPAGYARQRSKGKGTGDIVENTTALAPWSLTDVHEKLKPRLWPNKARADEHRRRGDIDKANKEMLKGIEYLPFIITMHSNGPGCGQSLHVPINPNYDQRPPKKRVLSTEEQAEGA